MMNANAPIGGDEDAALEDFAAKLAEAAYPVVLRHGGAGNWLALELELWHAMRKTVVKWAQDWPQAGVMLVSSVHPEGA
jgi:hypothetical protein